MADVLVRHYLIGVVIFCLIVVGGISMLGILNDKDPTYTSGSSYTQFNQSFNRLNDVTSTVTTLQTGITDASTDFGAFGVLDALISTSWQSLKLFFTSLAIMNDAYNGLSAVFGVPAWIPLLAIALITILIVFTIYSAIFRTEL